MKKLFRMMWMVAALLLPLFSTAQVTDYACSFDSPSDTVGWRFAGGSQPNQWTIGHVAADSVDALFVRSTDATANTYVTTSASVSYAYRSIELLEGSYRITYNWRAYGEGNYDYLRVFLAPASAVFSQGAFPDGSSSSFNFGNTVPSGWIALDGASRLNGHADWQQFAAEVDVPAEGSYQLVFMWANDASGGSNPPAAVDNLVFSFIPCPRPGPAVVQNLTTTSFDLTWSDNSNYNAYEWVVEIDSADQPHGTGIVAVTSDTTYSFFGLTPGTRYTLYVSAVCGVGDTSSTLVCNVTTPCNALETLPYYYDFETTPSGTSTSTNFVDCWYRLNDATTYFGYPYVGSSSSYSHSGGSRGLYWYHSTATGLYGTYQCIVLPMVDTMLIPMDSVHLTFWGRPSSSSYLPVFEVGLMTNPVDIATFVPVATVRFTSNDWDLYDVTFPRNDTLGAYIAVRAANTPSAWYAYLDEFTIDRIPACSYIFDAEVTNVSGASALCSWTLRGQSANPSYYIVTVTDLDNPATSPFTDTTSQPSYFISGLAPATNYSVSISSVCQSDTVEGVTVTFLTECLIGGPSDPSGTSATSTSGVPVYSSWGNTFCQSIYTAAELTSMGLTAGPITGVTYTWSSAGSYDKDFTIFMGQTANTILTASSPLTGSMMQVYNGIRTTADVGTIQYDFTTPFVWDGTSNIVLSSFVNQPAGSTHTSSGFYGYSTSCGATRTIYNYRDNVAYTRSNLTSGSAGSSTYRPNVCFVKACDTLATCAAPNVVVTLNRPDSVELRWAPGYRENSWNLSYKAESDTAWTSVARGLTATSHLFTGLQPMTNYSFRIYPDCGGDTLYAQINITTPCVPLATLPFTEDFENFTAPSTLGAPITSCWQRGTNYTSTNYPYLSTSTAHSGSNSMYFYIPTGNYYTYLALPAVAASIDSLQVSFAAMETSNITHILVGAMTDPDDFQTFTPIDTVAPSALGDWEMFEVPLTNYSGTGRTIVIAGVSDNSYGYVYIDDIEVGYQPSCPRPRDVTVSGITTTTAAVSWTDTAAGYFEIEYGPAGFTRGTGTVVTSATPSVTLYGLSASLPYEVYVRGFCTSNDTSFWSFVTRFVTECDIVTTLPYTQNFEHWGTGTNARPACWVCGGYSNYPYITEVANTSGKSLYMYSYSSNRVYASLPEIDTISYPVNILQTVFRAWSNASTSTSYSHDLIVGLCSTQGDMGTFTPADTITLTDAPMLYEVSFDTMLGYGRFITFVSTATSPATYNYVYLDSIAVEVIPDCQCPNNLSTLSITATSADIAWTDRASAVSWQVEYGPHGFAHGYGTIVTTTINPHTLTGLNPSTTYDFYVRANCGDGYSDWSRTPGRFTTMQNPATVPYFYDFENATEWDNWQTSTNCSVDWALGTAAGNGTNGASTGTHAMYISTDGGSTIGTYIDSTVNAAAYRDIDFGNIDTSFILSFRAAAGGCRVGNAVYDGLAIFMVDPADPLVLSGNPLTSPWGNINDLTPLATVYSNLGWNTYTAYLDTLTGVHRLVFFWFNQNTTYLGSFLGLPATVDDVSIQYVECPRPVDIHTTRVSMSSADIAWHGEEDADYRVFLRLNGSIVASELVHGPRVTFHTLSPGAHYNVYVRKICSDSDSSQLSNSTFTTLLCNDGFFDTIGNIANTTTSNNLPIANNYHYSYTQTIINSSELPSAGEIEAINFNYASSEGMTSKTNCTIYMGHTSLSSFASNRDFVDPSSLQVVYTGTLNCSQGWNRFEFSNPFPYDGSGNLLVAIDDNSGGLCPTSDVFYVDQTDGNTAIAVFSDVNNPTPTAASLASFSGERGIYAYRPQMIFDMCPPNGCSTPMLRTPLIRPDSVVIRWRNTGTAYLVGYRHANTSSWIVDNVLINDTFYVLHNLQVNSDYVYRVRQYCDTTGLSNWAVSSFNSGDIPCLSPRDLHVTAVTHKKVTLYWTPDQNNISYRIHVFNSFFDKYTNCYLAHGSVSNLEPGVTYYAAVQASCQDMDDPSEWSDTVSFTTESCPPVTNLVASDVQGNSVVVDWTEGGIAEEWEIQYGPAGFTQGEGSSVIVNTHPYCLTGLVGETVYDIVVRAICAADFYSNQWSNTVTITTPYSSISNVADDTRVRLYPNPTSADVELILPATGSTVRVEVVDVTGRLVQSYTLPAATERTTLATAQLATGAYYIRISGDELNAVKKLLVR